MGNICFPNDFRVLIFSDPPAVKVLPAEGVNVTEWHSCNITCHYNANPPNVTEVVWYKNGELLTSRKGHRAALHPKTFLSIHNVSRSDSGVYSCHVKNAFGRGNASNAIYLDVFCKHFYNLIVVSV